MPTKYDLFPVDQDKTTIEADRYRLSDALRLFRGEDDLVAEFPADTGIAENASVVV